MKFQLNLLRDRIKNISPPVTAVKHIDASQSGTLNLFSQFRENPKMATIRYTCIFLLIITGLFHLKATFLGQLSENQSPQMSNFSAFITHPDALESMARDKQVTNADLASALKLHKQALANFILHQPSWLEIVKILNEQGHKSEAITALKFIHHNFANEERVTWSKILLANELNQGRIMTECLLWLANKAPDRRKEIFNLATDTWADADVLMNKFGKIFYADILQEFIKRDDLKSSVTVWNKIVQSNYIQQKSAYKYINYLLEQNAFLLAAKTWSDTVGPGAPLLYNGTFEKPIIQSAFGWHFPSSKGMSWKQGHYGSGLEISFDGTENLSMQLSQTLNLNPGSYILNGSTETDTLTTDQLPFWQVQGVNCIGLYEKSQMVLPSQHTTDFILPFVVPGSCDLVQLSLVRNISSHFDNKIAGKMIVTDLKVTREKRQASLALKKVTHIPGQGDITQFSSAKPKTHISIAKLLVQ